MPITKNGGLSRASRAVALMLFAALVSAAEHPPLERLKQEAAEGDAAAQADLGLLYYRGKGVPQDFSQAAGWYRKAAEQGHAKAQYHLAGLYAAGEGVRRDPLAAARWLRRAAESGYPEAQASLAARLVRANQDPRAAAEWYRYAAEQGLSRAQHILGLFLHKGWGGLPPDPVQGQMWLILAASDPANIPHEKFAQERDAAAQRMGPAQAAEAQRLARAWKPKAWEELKEKNAPLIAANELVGSGGFFSAAGESIRAAELEYQAYWQQHIEESHRRILQAARRVSNPQRVLVLGAGGCREIPLEDLARRFKQVVLVDLDGPSMQEAVQSIPEDLRTKVEIRVSDVTSFAQPLMETTREIIANAPTTQDALARLEASYAAIEGQRRFPDLPAADLVVSSLVLSELPRYPSTYAARLFEKKFQTRLSEWGGYARVLDILRSFALKDHAELLARLCRPGGFVYYADTVARGPDLTRVSAAERESALTSLAGRFTRLGLFQQLRSQPEAWSVFSGVFQSVREPRGEEIPVDPNESLDWIIKALERTPDSSFASASFAAEAASRLLCQQWLPINLEVRAFEETVEAYEQANPSSMEELVETDEFLAALGTRGLRPVGSPEGWFWLEYACSIPRKAGAFRVQSWILQPDAP